MRKKLQETSWKKSNYEQPQRGHVCGLLSEGEPCSAGPTSQGGCPLIGLCVPSKTEGKYQCNRSENLGGSCVQGTFENAVCQHQVKRCQPVSSLMRKRALVTVGVAVGTFLFCIILLGGFSQSTTLSPGRLTFKHGHLNSDCTACHVSAESGLLNWVSQVPLNNIAMEDSQRCLDCHKEIGETPFQPHGMTAEQRAFLTKQIGNTAGVIVDKANPSSHRALACSTCHQEHNGKQFDIAMLSDAQCQNCHVAQFKNFAHGHPQLGEYPYVSRSKIYFDHARHFQKYFKNSEFKRLMPNGIAPESCHSCHSSDASGTFMNTKRFDAMCASCHESEITDIDFPGIPFFALPSFQASQQKEEAKAAKNNLFERWSKQNQQARLKKIPPFMEMLLSSDPQYQQAVKVLGDSSFRQLTASASEHPDAVGKYLQSIERLLKDVSEHGEDALQKRLGKHDSALAHMKPSIMESLITLDQRRLSETKKTVRPSVSESTSGGGWYIQNSDSSIRYRPTGHADPLLKNWLEHLVRENHDSVNPSGRLFKLLASPSASGSQSTLGPIASGRCLLCHSVEKDSNTGIRKINWEPLRSESQIKTLTHFSHKPHLISAKGEQCSSCHQFKTNSTKSQPFYQSHYLKRDRETSEWKIQTDSTAGLSCGFLPIKKESCATCHTKSFAGDSCLKCHNYHSHTKQPSLSP